MGLHTVLSVVLNGIGLVGFTRTYTHKWLGSALHFGILALYGRLGITHGIDLDWTQFYLCGRLIDTHTPLMG